MDNGLRQKQYNYALGLFKGLSQYEAYRDAKYSIKASRATIDANASRLAHNAKVLSLLEELREEAKGATMAGVIERKQILTHIARGDITDYLTCGPDRDLISVDKDSPHTKALSEVVSKTEYNEEGAGEAVVIAIKLRNPIPAIDLLNKMEGSYAPERHEHLGILLTGDLTDDELLRIATRHKPGRGGNGASEEKGSS